MTSEEAAVEDVVLVVVTVAVVGRARKNCDAEFFSYFKARFL